VSPSIVRLGWTIRFEEDKFGALKHLHHTCLMLISWLNQQTPRTRCTSSPKPSSRALFAWLISHHPIVLFSQNKSATNNQPAVLFSQNKPAPAISHQPNEQAASWLGELRCGRDHSGSIPRWSELWGWFSKNPSPVKPGFGSFLSREKVSSFFRCTSSPRQASSTSSLSPLVSPTPPMPH
jgi:hypothetical protein